MELKELVASDGGWINPRIFSDEELYRAEQRAVFGHSWLFVGHLSQLPEPGSFLRVWMGEESVLVTRDRSGAVRAHLNACRHRGFQVCQEDRGHASRFQCRYHGWVYGSDGALIGVPGEDTIYYGEVDKKAWGLIPVRVEVYKGLIFGCFDNDAPALVEWLGDMAWYLDILLDRREGGTELLGPHRWRIKANWKVVAENHCGDEYHIGFAHGSNFPPDIGANRATPLPLAREIRPGLGHGLGANIYPDELAPEDWLGAAMPPYPAHVFDYLRAGFDEAEKRLGRQRARISLIHGAVWPNLGMVPVFSTLRAIHPRGVNEVEMWSYCLVDRDAPPDVKAWMVSRSTTTFGPGGSFEQDDANNWSAVTRSSFGLQARKGRLNLQMGLGHEERSDRLPGELGLTASEINQRGFYRRWRQELEAAT